MKLIAKTLYAATALAAATLGLTASAQARTYVELGVSSYDGYNGYRGYGGPRYSYGGYRDGYYRDWDRDRRWRDHDDDRGWYRGGWHRDGYWRDRDDWRYRDRCWTRWERDGWSGRPYPVRVCR